MINITIEQIQETFERLKNYGYWAFYNDNAINKLKLKNITTISQLPLVEARGLSKKQASDDYS